MAATRDSVVSPPERSARRADVAGDTDAANARLASSARHDVPRAGERELTTTSSQRGSHPTPPAGTTRVLAAPRSRSAQLSSLESHVLALVFKPDGVYPHADIRGLSYRNLDHTIGTFLYAVSCLHCMAVSLAQGGEGLGAMWGEEKARDR